MEERLLYDKRAVEAVGILWATTVAAGQKDRLWTIALEGEMLIFIDFPPALVIVRDHPIVWFPTHISLLDALAILFTRGGRLSYLSREMFCIAGAHM